MHGQVEWRWIFSLMFLINLLIIIVGRNCFPRKLRIFIIEYVFVTFYLCKYALISKEINLYPSCSFWLRAKAIPNSKELILVTLLLLICCTCSYLSLLLWSAKWTVLSLEFMVSHEQFRMATKIQHFQLAPFFCS